EKVPVETQDEIGKLAHTFNTMLESLRQREKEKQFLELQLRHAQKMEAIGTLSGGIAHDFNNLLTAIIGFGSLIKMQAAKKEGGEENLYLEYVDQILASAQRAVTLTQNLLAFSRKQLTSIKRLNLNEVLSDFRSILVRLIREDIEFNLQLTDQELILKADSGQIDQIFMNLVTNAKDAMPNGGKLTITTELVDLPRHILVTSPSHYERKYARIMVTDTGIGMDEQTKERIFEPFFTTKEVGKGTGLGLSTIYGIVHQYEGYIEVETELGKGTTFKIYLPLFEEEPAEEPKSKKEFAPPPISDGRETILVAEDEDAVREVVKKILEGAGYKVIEASNGEEAIEQFEKNESEIDFLLLDVIMPKKNGKEVYQEIKKRKPDIKVLFITGYAAEVITQQAIIEEGLAVIPKPVLPPELLMKIKDVLTS
ncbi:MAG: response regulator, partial [Desulfobacterota bacterium]|nr:response regulator [Thermodesulfobacteriota bacterium]